MLEPDEVEGFFDQLDEEQSGGGWRAYNTSPRRPTIQPAPVPAATGTVQPAPVPAAIGTVHPVPFL